MGTLLPSFIDRLPDTRKRRFFKPIALLPPCDIPSGGRWVDLGCGDGVFTAILAALLGAKSTVLGLDRDRRALASLRHNAGRWNLPAQVTALQSDFTAPLPLSGLDGALAANALHFVPDSEKDRVLAAIGASLRGGGRLIIVEYNSARGTGAVPHPLPAESWLRRMERLGLRDAEISARTRSSYLGEMVAVQARLP